MIEFQNLCAGYDRTPVLSGISLRIEPGTFTVILGPNGCGKSTLLKSLVGLSDVYAGQILLEGRPLSDFSGAETAKRIAYLPQSRRVPDITVQRLVLHGRFPHLRYPRKYRRQDFEIARAAMERVGIAQLADQSLARLSGGTRQKVYIAMALAQDTPVITLDEPTTYLDIGHQLQVMELCRELARQGKAVAAVLHDLDLAMQYGDRMALLDRGHLVDQGSPEELYRSGNLQRVFGVQMARVPTDHGPRYFCFPE